MHYVVYTQPFTGHPFYYTELLSALMLFTVYRHFNFSPFYKKAYTLPNS